MKKITRIVCSYFLFCVLLLPAFLQSNQAGPKLCLTMVVQNDAQVIQMCLNNVKDLVDCISICDVGSTDATIKIIEQFFEDTGIPGKIYKHPWRNFGYNQTLSVQAAQKTLQELGFSLNNSYLFVLDADMCVHMGSEFRKESLNKDAYLLLEKAPSFSYFHYSLHLLRASLPWESIGLTHALWSAKGAGESAKLHTLTLEEQEDSRRQREKLLRNVQLLSDGLREQPGNARHMFFLAQSYKWLKRLDDAIFWYKSRIAQGGDQEETWFSKCMLGECFEEKEEWNEALYWYLEAYQQNPNRTASLRKIATHYRVQGQNDLAYIFAKHGSRIPFSDDQILFSSSPFYHYQFNEELSIAAYYTRFKEEGFLAADDLLLKKNVPWHTKDQAWKNILFYVQNLPGARFIPIDVDLPLIEEDSEERYHPMNPSIQKTEAGYQVICRAVNYTQTGAKIFNTIDKSGIFKTRNFFIDYDRDFKKLSQQEIIENLPREHVDCWIAANIQGLDDCRIFTFQNSCWFTCTTSDTNPTGNFQISLCKLAEKKLKGTLFIKSLTPLQGPDPYRCEKNWLPFLNEGELQIIYSYDPIVIYKPDIETGECKETLRYSASHDFSRFRGSAAPIAFNEGYLMLVHEVVQMANYERRYLHRFLYLDKNFIISQVSKPFTFRHIGIEFCLGMTLDHAGKELILTVGIEDREAWLCFVGLGTVQSLLRPLPIEPIFQN